MHEPKERAFLAFFISENGKKVNRTDVVDAFKVHNVNLLTAKLGVQVISTNLDFAIVSTSLLCEFLYGS